MTRDPDEVRVPPGRKNTRSWCGGHVGREHAPVWQPCNYALGGWLEYVCATCGRKLDRCFPWSGPCRCGHHKRRTT